MNHQTQGRELIKLMKKRAEGYTIVKKQDGKLKRYWAIAPVKG